MTIFLGLTGSIGMGKSTTAEMFRQAGIPVYDADATVHMLYAGKAAPVIEKAFPGTVENGVVDRAILSRHVVGQESQMKRLEALVHPLVREEEQIFRNKMRDQKVALAVLDNPLLFEMGNDETVDGVITVTAPFDVQRERVLARPDMTPEKFQAILARQVPDAEKRARSDFTIDTSLGIEHAQTVVSTIIAQVTSGNWRSDRKKHSVKDDKNA